MNACIGSRNHKAFVMYVILTFVKYLYLAVVTIVIIVIQDMVFRSRKVSEAQATEEIILDSCIFAVVTVKFLLQGCFKGKVSFGYLMLWICAEILIVQTLCLINIRDVFMNLAGLLLCISTSGVMTIWGIFKKQV